MKPMIRNASVYRVEIPMPQIDLEMALEGRPFVQPVGWQEQSDGFVPVLEHGALIEPFSGGYAFALRIDTKVIPASAAKAEVKRRVTEIEQREGRKPGKKEMREIKAEARQSLAAQALVRTNVVVCFYHEEQKLLVIPTTSRKVCDLVTTRLIHAADTVKSTTIHVSAGAGLTTRLKAWVDDDSEAFGDFEPMGTLEMVGDKRKLNLKVGTELSNYDAIREALKLQFEVTQLQLRHEGGTFRLSRDFKFRTVEVAGAETDGEQEELTWATQAYLEMSNMVKVVNTLCAMFGYKEEQQ